MADSSKLTALLYILNTVRLGITQLESSSPDYAIPQTSDPNNAHFLLYSSKDILRKMNSFLHEYHSQM